MTNSVPVVTVDGPSGVGKGTLCSLLARELGWHLLDSGSLYRVTAFAAQRQGVSLDDAPSLATLASTLDLKFSYSGVDAVGIFLAGENISGAIRSEACGNAASRVASISLVRQALLQRQRDFRQPPGLVADGRDMGTVVFPDAQAKIFLIASVEERALRRYLQLKDQGVDANLDKLSEMIAERDRRDSDRSVAPLRAASDAEVLDTTTLSIDKVKEIALKMVRLRIRGA